jgi:hypothetical protein
MKYLIIISIVILSILGCSSREDGYEPEKVYVHVEPKKTEKQIKKEIFNAIKDQDIKSIENIISEGYELNIYNKEGYTPLMLSVELNNAVIVEMLLNGGAKIFMPQKNNPSANALVIVNDSQENIKRKLQNNVDKLSKKIFKLLEGKKWGKLHEYIVANYVPPELRTHKDTTIFYEVFSSIKSIDSDQMDLSSYLLNDVKGHKILFQNKDLIYDSIETFKSAVYLENSFKIFIKNNVEITNFNIKSTDPYNIPWVLAKIISLKKFNIEISFKNENFEFLTEVFNLNIAKDEIEKILLLDLISEIATSKLPVSEKASFVNEAINTSLKLSISESNYLIYVNKILKMWKINNLPLTGYNFDEKVSVILASVKNNGYPESLMGSLITNLYSFSSGFTTYNNKSVRFIFENEFSYETQKKLLKLIVKTTGLLPSKTIYYAIKHSKVSLMEYIIKLDTSFKPVNHISSVESAVINTDSGETAVSVLRVLNKYHVQFNNKYGVSSLSYALNKYWNGDETYKSTVVYILSHSKNPFSIMKTKDSFEILKKQLQYVKANSTDWEVFRKLLKSFTKNEGETYSTKYYIESPYINTDNRAKKLEVTLLGDYILTAYKISNISESKSDSMLSLLPLIINKVKFTSLFYRDWDYRSALKHDQKLTVYPITLSAILSIEKDSIINALLDNSDSDNFQNVSSSFNKFSWEAFINSQFYSNLTTNRIFWKKVLNITLDSVERYKLPWNDTSGDFVKIILASGLHKTNPDILSKIDLYDVRINDTMCSIKASIVHDYERKMSQENSIYKDIYKKTWTSIGTFEILEPLKAKTCNNIKLNSNELKFMQRVVKRNIKNKNFDNLVPENIETKRTEFGCFESSLFPYLYTELGTLYEDRLENVYNVQTNEKCYMYEKTNVNKLYGVKKFLKQWFQCSKNTNDIKLTNYFESIEDILNLNKVDQYIDINICKRTVR